MKLAIGVSGRLIREDVVPIEIGDRLGQQRCEGGLVQADRSARLRGEYLERRRSVAGVDLRAFLPPQDTAKR